MTDTVGHKIKNRQEDEVGKKKSRLQREDEFDIENDLEINTFLCSEYVFSSFKYPHILSHQLIIENMSMLRVMALRYFLNKPI